MIVEWSLPGAPHGGEDKCNTSRVKRRVPPRFINKHKGMRAGHRAHIASLLPQPGGQVHTAVALSPVPTASGTSHVRFPPRPAGEAKNHVCSVSPPRVPPPRAKRFQSWEKTGGRMGNFRSKYSTFLQKTARSAGRAGGGKRFRKFRAKESPGRCPATPTPKLPQRLPQSCCNFYLKVQQLLPKSC